MFWFDKNNPDVLFVDKRSETVTAKDGDKVRTIEVKPDIIADFTDLPFKDESFYMVVFDPPHLKSLGETSWMVKKYGKLPENWKDVISKGFDECIRVLKPHGVLIFNKRDAKILALETFARNADLLIELESVSDMIRTTKDCELVNEAFDELAGKLMSRAIKLKNNSRQ